MNLIFSRKKIWIVCETLAIHHCPYYAYRNSAWSMRGRVELVSQMNVVYRPVTSWSHSLPATVSDSFLQWHFTFYQLIKWMRLLCLSVSRRLLPVGKLLCRPQSVPKTGRKNMSAFIVPSEKWLPPVNIL